MLSQLGWDTGHTGQAPDLNPASIGNRNCPQKNCKKLSQLHARSTETRFYFALYLSLTISDICSMHYWVVLPLNDIYCLDLSKDSFDFDPSLHELSSHTPSLEVVSEYFQHSSWTPELMQIFSFHCLQNCQEIHVNGT